MIRKPLYLVVWWSCLLVFLIIYLLKPDNFGKDVEISEENQISEEWEYDNEFGIETGVVEDPSIIIDPLLEQTKTNQEIIDTRLEYYKQHKKELWVE